MMWFVYFDTSSIMIGNVLIEFSKNTEFKDLIGSKFSEDE